MSNFWRDRPVFVTGATGLLGSWLVKRLLVGRANVVCLVRDWVPKSELVAAGALERIAVVRGDVCDGALVERVLAEYEIDTVFHLAAQAIVTVANRNPLSTFETNIRGTWTLLEACRRSPKVQQILLASSDKAYGEQKVLPYDETMPLQGRNPYDVSKTCADLIARSYAHVFELPVAVTRCGNFYGGGDLNWNRIVPGTVRSILRGEPPLIRSDGTHMRDYFYVEDGAAAYMLLGEKLAADRSLVGEAFNFSNELRISVRELVDVILAHMRSDLRPIVLNQASNEIEQQYLSAEKARTRLDWRPHFTLAEGLDRTIAWYRKHLT